MRQLRASTASAANTRCMPRSRIRARIPARRPRAPGQLEDQTNRPVRFASALLVKLCGEVDLYGAVGEG